MKILRTIMLLSIITISPAIAQNNVNIYSHRQPFLIEPVLNAFTQETNIQTKVIYSPSGGLVQRMLAEGKNSPADVILTSDIADISLYAENNLLAQINSKIIENNIPKYLIHKNKLWFAVSKRARILALSKHRTQHNNNIQMEDLAQPQWKGRVCTRPGSHVYNRALMASMIHAHGSHKARKWGQGLVNNLARKPQGNDRAQAKAIHEGICDVAVMNSYYYGKMKYSDKPQQKIWAESIRLAFTNQNNRGNHINISAAGLSKYAKNKQNAMKFLEFLSSPKAQKIYSEINFEYPANPNVKPSQEVSSWGQFKEDSAPISRISELSKEAQKIINQIGW